MRVFWLSFTAICLAFALAYRSAPKSARKYAGRHRAPGSPARRPERLDPLVNWFRGNPEDDVDDYGDERLSTLITEKEEEGR